VATAVGKVRETARTSGEGLHKQLQQRREENAAELTRNRR
jgi:hypothetical protein